MYSILSSFIVGLIAKKIDPQKLLFLTLLLVIPGVSYANYCLDTKSHLGLGVGILIVMLGILTRLLPLVFLNKIFPEKFRLGGVYMSTNLSYTLFGVFSPIIVIALMHATHAYFKSRAAYTDAVAIISIIGCYFFNRVKEPNKMFKKP